MLRRILRHHHFMQNYLLSVLANVFTRPGFVFMVFSTLTAIFLASGLFYWIESSSNPNVSSFLDAFYFSTSTFTTVGFGDIAPVTRPGRVLAIVMMFFGSLTYVSFMAIVSSSIVELDLAHRESRRKEKDIK